uniref:Uncharacterized protein n=1 Tax=Globodera pallida TaxID=36090 RepID=A0A183CNW1_GLOPA
MPISAESTTGEGDITADQEIWGHPKNCAFYGPELPNWNANNRSIRQLYAALRAELAQKLLNAHMTLQTKMEEYQNKQQQNFDDLTKKLKVLKGQGERKRKMDESLKSVQTMVDAELEAENQSNANKFAEFEKQKQSNANKFAELEKQKQSKCQQIR